MNSNHLKLEDDTLDNLSFLKDIFKKETNFIKELRKKTNLDKVTAYFIHSYNFILKNDSERIVTTNYGQEITAMVSKSNIIGTQFHPEKSHNFGLAFLKTFLECEEFE